MSKETMTKVLKQFFLLFVFASLPNNASAFDPQDPYVINGIRYDFRRVGATVVEVDKSLREIIIPSEVTIDDYVIPVTIIGYESFKDSSVENIFIPSSVNTIESGAFAGCKSLTSIDIPESVTYVGTNAFYDTGWYDSQSDGLLSMGNWILGYKGEEPKGLLSIPEGTIGVAGGAFSGLLDLTSVTMSNSVKYICDGAFSGCKNLTTVNLSNNLISLGGFYDCTSLTSITIPNSVTTISNYAFSGCTGLTNITIPNSVTTISSRAFEGCSGLTNITIPNSVTEIGEEAFRGCSGLTAVTIGSNVTFGRNVFTDLDNLMSVTSYITRPSDLPIYKKPFFSKKTYDYGTLYVPKGTKDIYIRYDGWRDFYNIVEFDPSDINKVTLDDNEKTSVYDLNGRLILKPRKGINIIRGKKIIKK